MYALSYTKTTTKLYVLREVQIKKNLV